MKENRNMRDTEMFDGENVYIIHNYVKLPKDNRNNGLENDWKAKLEHF